QGICASRAARATSPSPSPSWGSIAARGWETASCCSRRSGALRCVGRARLKEYLVSSWYVACAEVSTEPLPLASRETGLDAGLAVFLATPAGEAVEHPVAPVGESSGRPEPSGGSRGGSRGATAAHLRRCCWPAPSRRCSANGPTTTSRQRS